MMTLRYFWTLLFIFLVLVFSGNANAQSPTTSETLNEKLNSQISELKDKIASRVSELDLVEKRGITGTVVEASTSQITLKDIKGETRLIDVDEITDFSSSADNDFGISDLEEGVKINILGLYNKESKRLLARFISTAINPVFVSGAISAINDEEFTVDVLAENSKSTTVDVATSTKTNEYDEEGESTRSGFSQLEIANRVLIIGLTDTDEPNIVVAERIIVLPTLPKNPAINIPEPAPATSESSDE